MDTGTLGAIVGGTLGALGAAVGTAVSLQNAKSASERRYIIKWAISFAALIVGFLVGLFLVPPEQRVWLWVPYLIVLPIAVRACNRGHARFHSAHRPPSA